MREHRYNGPEYEPNRDNPRLDSQLERVRRLMLDGEWRTLQGIADATTDPVASISAQLRHLRKERFGSYIVDRRHVGRGLYEYRVSEPPNFDRGMDATSAPASAPVGAHEPSSACPAGDGSLFDTAAFAPRHSHYDRKAA